MLAKRDDLIDDLAELVLDGAALDEDATPGVGLLQQLAFTIWGFEAGRDLNETQRILHERSGMQVSLHDLRKWRREGAWGESVGQVHQALGVSATTTVRGTLQVASVKAAVGLLRVLNDPNATNNEIIRAASTILDRTGFPVMIRGEMFNGLDVAVNDNVSDEELEAQWSEYQPIPPDPMDERHGDMTRLHIMQDKDAWSATQRRSSNYLT